MLHQADRRRRRGWSGAMRVGGKRRRRGWGASSERERRRHGGAAPPGTEIQSGGAVGFGKPGACAAACWERAGWAWGWDGGASRTGVACGLARRAQVWNSLFCINILKYSIDLLYIYNLQL